MFLSQAFIFFVKTYCYKQNVKIKNYFKRISIDARYFYLFARVQILSVQEIQFLVVKDKSIQLEDLRAICLVFHVNF